MDRFYLFISLVSISILLPGPNIVFTLSNALQHGLRSALSGIAGMVFGLIAVALVSAGGLAVVLQTSTPWLVRLLQALGALYLLYLGLRNWRRALQLSLPLQRQYGLPQAVPSPYRVALEGALLQTCTPNTLIFFTALLPQFIVNSGVGVGQQIAGLAFSYAVLVIVIHGGYAVLAGQLQRWPHARVLCRWLGQLGGATMIGFAIVMLVRATTI